ncbi:MAG: proteasome subunit beta [Candidatus Poribacteria bacterium]|nr:proteasome subunit beta [Candidatus Poribacteria bacterium]
MVLDVSGYRTSDFLEILKRERPDLLARFGIEAFHTTPLPDVPASNWTGSHGLNRNMLNRALPHDNLLEGTTILAAVYNGGVLIAGDRQATAGFQVGERRIEKVYEVDTHSAIAIAGVAGPSIDMAQLFQVQVEYYEKVEGSSLSLEGKANYLSNMVKQNLGMALQGWVIIPIFAGYDLKRKQGKVFKYDVTGGRYDESEYYATGSGGKDAQTTLKKLYRPDMSRDEIVKIVVEALWDAADEDLGTGGPDFIREIFPTVKLINQTGISDVPDSEIKELYTELFERLSRIGS